MAEVNDTTVEVSENSVKSFLDKFGFDSLEKAEEVLGKYKNDLKGLKSKAQTADELQKKLEEYERLAEEKRKSELSEVDRLKEELDKKDMTFQEMQNQLESMKKDRIFDRVMFDHMKDMPLSGTRSKLYAMAVKTSEWSTAEELQEILTQVDNDFDAEIASAGIKLPAPGDGENGNRTTGSKYDEKYFKDFYKKK